MRVPLVGLCERSRDVGVLLLMGGQVTSRKTDVLEAVYPRSRLPTLDLAVCAEKSAMIILLHRDSDGENMALLRA